ncbi:MAG: hypothetical protein GWO08_01650 [Gammaproteobacteria bacterium]|nr:hypothetical protein [candidate division Zixibacteria bacterium]NIR62282.1 hypothetical protein [candidate division Zixibacteria bacterium]NIR92411.1 hypothetical protein [Gammaproteobacteria bacterium]NIS44517.1 hypothetical protein [candidate division Zixibacteria bacterium]NIU12532.1 hypothetical protein [candidate division Zixibacteria bacterium]
MIATAASAKIASLLSVGVDEDEFPNEQLVIKRININPIDIKLFVDFSILVYSPKT